MEEKNYLKIVWIIAFMAFASISCWATAESLSLLLPSWQPWMLYIISIGFFIIASIGTKMIVDSLNQDVYVEKRGLMLTGGIILLLVFWILCSLPTNTHTFFYRSLVRDEVTTDISTTKGYLEQIKDNTKNKEQASLKVQELDNNVDILLGELEAEIKNESNPGFGTKSKEILRKLAPILGVAKIEPLTYGSSTKSGRQKLCDAYRTKIYILKNTRAENIKKSILSPSSDILREVNKECKNLDLMKRYIDDNTINLNKPKDIEGVCDKLNLGYNTIRKNKNFVNFISIEDKEQYTQPNSTTRVKRLLSVFTVWKDFIKGKYAGHGFIFWLILSILVDIAAFVFFDLAFKKIDE